MKCASEHRLPVTNPNCALERILFSKQKDAMRLLRIAVKIELLKDFKSKKGESLDGDIET